MTKALSNVVSLEFHNKNTNKKEKTFDQILKVAKFIGRANYKTKSIGNKNSKFLLAHIADRINRSKTGIIFINHDEISEITEARRRQNTNIIDQLTDIFNFEYHRFIIFEGSRKYYGYTVKYTDDGIDRIKTIIRNIVANNPETEIWGGNKAFVSYMVKAVNSEKEYSKKGKANSIAEMDKQKIEQIMYEFENGIVTHY